MSADFNPSDPFAFLRQFWPQGGSPMQPFMPPLSEEEIERKIGELRVIENWLTMSMGMLSMQIKALEMQKAAMAALKPRDDAPPR
ncbi:MULTISPECIES: PhaM family polyhydroxyalkanoate granule multifunctional regulatory protein [Microvirgula]|uniref:Uncharacterized protein n=1 Tax=Microvirgula aerodenitrificans TaxID=57480 RepID=A0A2U3TH18_9NEIS|nr:MULTISPECIES: PhaM family polyhydroxyalkanoate granule multifunctional regulatory protein [Microvirgula]AVY92693.1 hypothetical protein DAI18_00495 [Microvirgula aerodenitrificans]RAS17432.1 hypothetical protein DFO50_10332 [Microvirgula sp. AG722]